MDIEKLRALRDQLDLTDVKLIQTIAERQAIVAEIGRVKETGGKQLRDFKREAEVLLKVRNAASTHALDPKLAEEVMKLLIGASLTQQERKRIRNAQLGDAKRALVLGGNGKMGRWFTEFLDALGFSVEIYDPTGAPDGFAAVDNWQASALTVDLIVLATPLGKTAQALDELVNIPSNALIVDIASVKSPLLDTLQNAAAKGLKICSIHPMFGPDTQLLSDRHVLLMNVGNDAAVLEARALFAATSAEIVEVPLQQHDELIAFVLGLSHAINIVFAKALTNSGAAAPMLATLSSTTFDRQLKIASSVASENPKLYFEIQALNQSREHSLQALEQALVEFTQLVRTNDETGFVQMMQANRDYLSQRSG
jgi:chorismate mutase / prephenate dehydrogenase